MKTGTELISEERLRQICVEGWSFAHDDQHNKGEMALAALCYIEQARGRKWLPPEKYQSDKAPDKWPWDDEWWKPKSPVRDLVRAGALIAAEIDRIQRFAIDQARKEANEH